MPQIIDLPDGNEAEFPDSMSQEEIIAVLQEQFPEDTAVDEPEPDPAPEPEEEPSFIDEALGVGENFLSAVTGFAGDVAGGLTGGLQSGLDTLTDLTRGKSLDEATDTGFRSGDETMRSIQDALTFQPRTETGKRNLRKMGKLFNDVIELDKQDPIPIVHQMRQLLGQEDNAVGNFMADVARQTGSPTLEAFAGAFGSTLGPGALEIAGFKGSGRLARGTGFRQKKALDAQAFKELMEAAPTPEKYLQTARGTFKETHDLGATVKTSERANLVQRIREGLENSGYDPDINPEGAVENMLQVLESGAPITSKRLATIQNGMNDLGTPGSQQRLFGQTVSGEINDFLGGADVLDFPQGVSAEVGEAYRVARRMYGQGKRGQAIQNVITDAARAGKDFQQTLTTGLNNLIKGQIFKKGQGRWFTKADRKIMENMMADGRGERFLQNVSKLSPFRDNAGGLATLVAGFTAVGIDVAAFAGAPLVIGEAAKIWGEAIFKGKAKLGNALIRAGADGRKIARAYVENVPKAQRSADDLSQLLLNPAISLENLPKTKFTRETMRLIDEKRKALIATGAAGASSGLVTEPNDDIPLN